MGNRLDARKRDLSIGLQYSVQLVNSCPVSFRVSITITRVGCAISKLISSTDLIISHVAMCLKVRSWNRKPQMATILTLAPCLKKDKHQIPKKRNAIPHPFALLLLHMASTTLDCCRCCHRSTLSMGCLTRKAPRVPADLSRISPPRLIHPTSLWSAWMTRYYGVHSIIIRTSALGH